MKVILNLLGIFSMAQLLTACNFSEPEDFLIPQGYKGKVYIVFNQKLGANIKYENGRRIYEVPANGILLTQFKDQYGFIDHLYYYVGKTGKRTALEIYRYQYDKDRSIKWVIENPHKPGVFFDGITGIYGGKEGNKYREFVISSYNNLDIFYTDKYVKNFENRLQNLAPGGSVDTFSESQMDSMENIFNKKRVSN